MAPSWRWGAGRLAPAAGGGDRPVVAFPGAGLPLSFNHAARLKRGFRKLADAECAGRGAKTQVAGVVALVGGPCTSPASALHHGSRRPDRGSPHARHGEEFLVARTPVKTVGLVRLFAGQSGLPGTQQAGSLMMPQGAEAVAALVAAQHAEPVDQHATRCWNT